VSADTSDRHCFRSRDEAETCRAAACLCAAVEAAAGGRCLVLSLVGPLGAGKTAFVKGLAEGLGLDPAGVSSPTFVIAHQYGVDAPRPLNHVDFYRLESAAELETSGFFDLLAGNALVAVEWGNCFAEELPRDHLEIRLERVVGGSDSGDDGDASTSVLRDFEAVAHGSQSRAVLSAWRVQLSAAGIG
jgi:tRNA threonylcarbamoyladenosine biosynthesis protein TsaE